MPVYINITSGRDVETIDEFDTWKEARAMLAEYRLVYQGTEYRAYLSRRSTKAWRDAPRTPAEAAALEKNPNISA